MSRFTEDHITPKELNEFHTTRNEQGFEVMQRPTKFLNRKHKSANHKANLATRQAMNQAADLSKSNPRPGKIVGSAAPYRPKRYVKAS